MGGWIERQIDGQADRQTERVVVFYCPVRRRWVGR